MYAVSAESAGSGSAKSVAARARRRYSRAERATTVLARTLIAAARRTPWRASLTLGARLGDLAAALGIRRGVATQNLAAAFPALDPAARGRILRDHYRELGRVCMEYARLADLVRRPAGEVIARVDGFEHLVRAREAGRGAIVLGGHFGNIELMGAHLGTFHPVDFVVKPLSNPGVEAWISAERRAAGVGQIALGAGLRGAYAALRANHWVAMLADQDARRHGAFVPFFGRLASTPTGPAALALRAGAPIIMGLSWRLPDGRHVLEIDPPLQLEDAEAPGAVERLTALHTARLEARVREHPEAWFWLHRRWKTPPP
jgi:KDO2-lipid IV(A) lauroyltransferase